MLFLIALVLAFTFAVFGGASLKKHPYLYYAAATLLTAGMAFLPSVNTRALPAFVNSYVLGLFTRGALATAFWCVVMITGALKNGSAPMKKLMPIRGELSIFAAILTLGHNIGYGQTYFVMLVTDPGRMSANQLCASLCTIAMLCIMLPLTVLSFPKIRKKMNARRWKAIQRTAYLFYALIYVHVLVLTLPLAQMGRQGYTFSVLVYTLVFLGYAFFRVRKALLKKGEGKAKIAVSVLLVVTLLLIILVTFAAMPKATKGESPKPQESISTTETLPAETSCTSAETTAAITETTAETTSSTTVETTVESTGETSAESTEAASEETITEAVPEEPEPPQEAPQPELPEPAPEPQYVYNNGTFSATVFGYDGDVHITVTIENDVITDISGWSEESDAWYFDTASGQVIPAILAAQSPDVDACSGATYSSRAIMDAVRNALASAKR